MGKRGLGKGLDALFIPEEKSTEPSGDRVVSLRITEVEPNKDQPRKQFDPEQLKELSHTIL